MLSQRLLCALSLTLAATACQHPQFQPRSFLAPGQFSTRLSTSVWSDDGFDGDADEVRSNEWQVEYAPSEGVGLVAGIGSRDYRFDTLDDFDTTEFSLGVRSYSLPFSERVIGYFLLGARYGDLPGSEYSIDLDTGFGLVFPFEGFHLDLNLTRGLAITGGDLPFLDNWERHHVLASVGVGWTFGKPE